MERQSKVLVVDDDQFALRSIAKVLEGESYQMVTAAGGSEAIDLLKRDSFDLVLTDLKMPEVDGLEVLRQAKEIAPQAVVLILTGYVSLESAVEVLREGAYDYLVKPYSVDELKLKIERGLERVRLTEERKRAEEEIQQRTTQLEALRQVGLDLTAQLDLDVLLHSIVSRAIELVGGTNGGLYLYWPERDVLEWSMAVGPHLAHIGTVLHRGEGLSGRVWETGEPLIVDDYQAWEKRAAVYGGYPFRAVVGVPVRWGEEFLGVLNVLADPPRTFSPADAELLSLFATQAAIAIRNARLYEETQQRALEQEMVSRIAYALNTPDIRDAYPVLVEGLQNLTSCEVVSLIAMDEAGEQCIVTVLESPFPIPGEGDVMPLSATAAAEDLEVGRPHLTADLGTKTHFPFEQALHQAGLHSWITLPLLVGGEVFGGLNLGGSDTGLFREYQLPVLQQVADVVALALQNSFIFLAERERRHIAETLRQASTVLSSTLELEEVLRLILGQLGQVIPYDSASVQRLEGGVLSPSKGEHLKIVACQGFEEPDKVVGLVFPLDPKFPNHRVVTTKAPLAIEDITQDYPHFQDEADTYESGRIRSWLGVPLVVKDQVIGMITLDRAEVRPYTAEESELAMAFANQAAIALENARLYEAAQQEITDRKRVEEELAYMATHDSLTGVPNRLGFFTLAEQQLKMAGRTKQRMVLLFADFDHLKQINDTLGHPEGDRALIEAAEVLTETFRESDVIARIGGDEFAVLAVETDEASPDVLITRLQKNLGARNAEDDRRYELSLSIGLARYDPKHPCSIDELLAQADRAMYEQKRGNQKAQ